MVTLYVQVYIYGDIIRTGIYMVTLYVQVYIYGDIIRTGIYIW